MRRKKRCQLRAFCAGMSYVICRPSSFIFEKSGLKAGTSAVVWRRPPLIVNVISFVLVFTSVSGRDVSLNRQPWRMAISKAMLIHGGWVLSFSRINASSFGVISCLSFGRSGVMPSFEHGFPVANFLAIASNIMMRQMRISRSALLRHTGRNPESLGGCWRQFKYSMTCSRFSWRGRCTSLDSRNVLIAFQACRYFVRVFGCLPQRVSRNATTHRSKYSELETRAVSASSCSTLGFELAGLSGFRTNADSIASGLVADFSTGIAKLYPPIRGTVTPVDRSHQCHRVSPVSPILSIFTLQ